MTYPTGPKTDYVTEALSRLLSQYQGKPFLEALVSALVGLIQRRELATWEVINYRLLPVAEGAQLAAIGRIVGVQQASLSDAQFRREIQVAILLLRSQGTPDEVQKVLTLALPPGAYFEYWDESIATIRIALLALEPLTVIEQVYRLGNLARAAGVRFMFSFPVLDPSVVFATRRMADVSNAAQGLSSYASPVGGWLRGLRSTS